MQWMIYGATGYTGQLVVEAALARGHQPLLAGRNPDKLDDLSRRTGLPYVAFRLDDEATIGEAIADMDIVYHAAGPFIHTSDPMIRACLATRTHYLDITGEISVYENTFSYDDAARKNGIALISGVGFDVVPTDCLGLYVAQQVDGATSLEMGFVGFAGASSGTAKSMLEMMPYGSYVRQDGDLFRVGTDGRTRHITFSDGKTRLGMSIPWGDLSTSYRSTGVPNITTYAAVAPITPTLLRLAAPFQQLLRIPSLRGFVAGLLERTMHGPTEEQRMNTSVYLWGQASNEAGQSVQAWLVTAEPYQFTAWAGVLAVERTAELNPLGALSPAQAFGADFVLDVEGTQRFDSLP